MWLQLRLLSSVPMLGVFVCGCLGFVGDLTTVIYP